MPSFKRVVQFLYIFVLLTQLASASSCHELFKAMVDRGSKVDYQINLDRVYTRIRGWSDRFKNELRVSEAFEYDGEPVLRVDIPSRSKSPRARIIITAGVHGNESIGVATLIDVVEKMIYDPKIREDFDFVIFPALNPGGLRTNSRYLLNGDDFNRTFKEGSEGELTLLLKDHLRGERFDLGLDMHEAFKKDGFFVIRAQEDDVDYIGKVLGPFQEGELLRSPNGLYPYNVPNSKNPNLTSYVLTAPGVTSSFNAGTVKSFFKNDLGVTHSYTVESGGQIELSKRQEIYTKLMMSFIENY